MTTEPMSAARATPPRRRSVGRALPLALLATTLGAAADGRLPAPGTGEWRPLSLPKVDRETVYAAVRIDDVDAVRAESDCSASALLLPTRELDLARTPRLAWQWRVERAPDVPDARVKQGDDFAARVYVMFEFDPERAGFFERARHRLGRAIYGDVVPGSALNYVWSPGEPRGAAWDNPFAATSKMVSLGAAPLGEWRSEQVNVADDYARLFGFDAPAPLGLALMSDSDNSCQRAEALFANFRFLPAEVARGTGAPLVPPSE